MEDKKGGKKLKDVQETKGKEKVPRNGNVSVDVV